MEFPIRANYAVGLSSEYATAGNDAQLGSDSCWLSPQSISSHHNDLPRQVLQDISFSGPTKPNNFRPGVQKMTSRTKRPPASAYEEDLVKRIHRGVGGAARLSTFDDPSVVRQVVIEALATEQALPIDAERVRRGQLSALERRAVRTVTNRGAAVRSRVRQRRELEELRELVHARDGRVRHLEAVVRALCAAYAVPLPPTVPPSEQIHSLNSHSKEEEQGFGPPCCSNDEEENVPFTNCTNGASSLQPDGIPGSLLTDYTRLLPSS